MKRSTLLAAAAFAFAASVPVQAQQFPSKPVEILVSFAAGGSTDLSARILAKALEKKWNQPVKVVNKPGGNSVPAVNDLMAARPDGHLVLLDGLPSATLMGVVVKGLPYKITDRTFVVGTTQTAMIFVVPTDSPFKSLKDAVDQVKKQPETFTWTSLGIGSLDFAARQLFLAAGVDASKTRAVPLKGGSEAATQTAGGHVTLGIGSYSSVHAVLGAKKVRALAVAGAERDPNIPDVPTTKEAGFPSVIAVQWNAISGPPKLPAAVQAAWTRAIQETLKDKEVVAELMKLGLIPYFSEGPALREYVEKEMQTAMKLWAKQ